MAQLILVLNNIVPPEPSDDFEFILDPSIHTDINPRLLLRELNVIARNINLGLKKYMIVTTDKLVYDYFKIAAVTHELNSFIDGVHNIDGHEIAILDGNGTSQMYNGIEYHQWIEMDEAYYQLEDWKNKLNHMRDYHDRIEYYVVYWSELGGKINKQEFIDRDDAMSIYEGTLEELRRQLMEGCIETTIGWDEKYLSLLPDYYGNLQERIDYSTIEMNLPPLERKRIAYIVGVDHCFRYQDTENTN